jgi:glycerol-3-phosphate acyltransferase PlsY
MSAAVAAPIAAWGLGYPGHVKALAAIALAVLILHRANIARLMKGEEPKVGSRK